MADQIVQLKAADFEEAMDFLNLVFSANGPRDMERLIPTIYRPTDEHMGCNYAIKQEGSIKAIVGVFPLTWHVGDRRLHVAGIGGVSTHPRCRGQGLMRQLMEHCVELIRKRDFDLSWLGGQRQRYRYFGYEVCGNALSFTFNRSNLRHGYSGTPGIRFAPIGQEDTVYLRMARALHDRQRMHSRRAAESFFRHCISWKCHPWAALGESDEMIGYLVAKDDASWVPELAADTTDGAVRMVRAWVGREGGPNNVTFQLNSLPDELLHDLGGQCERITVNPTGNWMIVHWAEVVDALMRVRVRSGALVDGAVVLDIENYGAIKLSVAKGHPKCEKRELRDSEQHLACDPVTAMRLLFGPSSPSQVVPPSSKLKILEAWCPLPLSWPAQDHV